MCYNYGHMRFTRDSLILAGVLVGVVALTAPALARPLPTPTATITTTYYSATSTPATTTTPASTSETTTESVAITTPPAIVAQPSAVLTNLTAQLNSLLQQLITLLTVQIQQLQAQLAGIPTPTPTPSTAATPTATTTAQTAATATVATTPNSPPRVNVVYPYSGLEFTTPASTDVVASALDEDGTISKVEFFEGTNSLGTHTGSSGPWSVRWNSISAGTYALTAKATDDKGGQTTSAPVALTVKAIGAGTTGFTDSPPTVTIAGFGATASSGQTISIVATAATYAGSISQVVFYRASSNTAGIISTDLASPFQVSTTVGVTGTWTLSATATNSQGSVTNSGSTTIGIGPN